VTAALALGWDAFEELLEGVRYFDLRPCWIRDNSEDWVLALYHGPVIGPWLEDVLNDVQKFMNEGSRELLILKFSHFGNFSDTVYRTMVQMITDKLGTWLCPSTPAVRLADTSLSNFIATRGAVLVVCDDSYPVNNPTPNIYTYRDWNSSDPQNGQLTVCDQYSNTTSAATMTADQTAKFAAFDGKCQNNSSIQCDLFLLSWTLTPVTAVWYYAKQVNPILDSSVRGMANPNSYGQCLNILYVDYVEYADATGICLRLNGIAS